MTGNLNNGFRTSATSQSRLGRNQAELMAQDFENMVGRISAEQIMGMRLDE
jgi:hypothetical protein